LIDAEVVDIIKFIDAHIDSYADGDWGEVPSIPTIRKLIDKEGTVEIGVHGRSSLYPTSYKDTCISIYSDNFIDMCGKDNPDEFQQEVLKSLDTALGMDLMWFEREVVKVFKRYNRTLYNTLRDKFTEIHGKDWEQTINASNFADVCELGKMRKVLHPPSPKGGGKRGEFIVERTDYDTVGGTYVIEDDEFKIENIEGNTIKL